MLYFKTVWKIKEKFFLDRKKKDLTQCFGTRMDMLNLQWICRAKKYYHLPEGEIYAMIIPISLHLEKNRDPGYGPGRRCGAGLRADPKQLVRTAGSGNPCCLYCLCSRNLRANPETCWKFCPSAFPRRQILRG